MLAPARDKSEPDRLEHPRRLYERLIPNVELTVPDTQPQRFIALDEDASERLPGSHVPLFHVEQPEIEEPSPLPGWPVDEAVGRRIYDLHRQGSGQLRRPPATAAVDPNVQDTLCILDTDPCRPLTLNEFAAHEETLFTALNQPAIVPNTKRMPPAKNVCSLEK